MFGSATVAVSLDGGKTWAPLDSAALAKDKTGRVVQLDDVIDQNDYEMYNDPCYHIVL